jgi:hypothetical protein
MWGLEGGFQSTWSLQQWLQTHNPPGKNKISCMFLTECLVSMFVIQSVALKCLPVEKRPCMHQLEVLWIVFFGCFSIEDD